MRCNTGFASAVLRQSLNNQLLRTFMGYSTTSLLKCSKPLACHGTFKTGGCRVSLPSMQKGLGKEPCNLHRLVWSVRHKSKIFEHSMLLCLKSGFSTHRFEEVCSVPERIFRLDLWKPLDLRNVLPSNTNTQRLKSLTFGLCSSLDIFEYLRVPSLQTSFVLAKSWLGDKLAPLTAKQKWLKVHTDTLI